jgi:hypothetical protein
VAFSPRDAGDARSETSFQGDRAVGDARAFEKSFRDFGAESAHISPHGRLCRLAAKCIAGKAPKAGGNSASSVYICYVVSNTQVVAADAVLQNRSPQVEFPAGREFGRENRRICAISSVSNLWITRILATSRQNTRFQQQGIFSRSAGNSLRRAGNLEGGPQPIVSSIRQFQNPIHFAELLQSKSSGRPSSSGGPPVDGRDRGLAVNLEQD